MQTVATITSLTKSIRQTFEELNGAEQALGRDINLHTYRSWLFGKQLNAVKAALDHGSFTIWREQTFPKLNERKARRCQELYTHNSNRTELSALGESNLSAFVSKLDANSVRKFRSGYVPDKDKPHLAGDKRVTRSSHYLGILNDLNKFVQRLEAGHATAKRSELLDFSKRLIESGERIRRIADKA